jgi:hypothetical protein
MRSGIPSFRRTCKIPFPHLHRHRAVHRLNGQQSNFLLARLSQFRTIFPGRWAVRPVTATQDFAKRCSEDLPTSAWRGFLSLCG